MADIGVPPPPPPPVAAAEPVITQDERTMAVLAHALQMVGWFIAPLVILVVRRESRFVSFHALQALLLQVTYVLLFVVFMVIWFAVMFGTIARAGSMPNAQPPPVIFAIFPLFWLAWMALWILMIVAAIVYAIKAGRGEWAEYPLLGKLARRLLGF